MNCSQCVALVLSIEPGPLDRSPVKDELEIRRDNTARQDTLRCSPPGFEVTQHFEKLHRTDIARRID